MRLQTRGWGVVAATCRNGAFFLAALLSAGAASAAGQGPNDPTSPRPTSGAPPGADPSIEAVPTLSEAAPPAAVEAQRVSTAVPGSSYGVSLSSAESASMRSYGKDWLVNPDRELEVSANLRFLVAPDGPFGGRAVRFTDVGLFGIQARYSTGGRFEFAGAVNLLAKQPTNSDEPVAQGGNLGVRFRLHRKWALWAQGAGGPMLAGLGNWGEGGGGVQARVDMHEHMRFQASLGGAYTRLYADDGKDPWFAEVASHGEMIFTWPGDSGLWLGADYRVPVAHGDGAFALDPKVRLSVEVGTTLGFVDNWDLYGVFRFIDRGDLREPSTTIPVLDGGFDQVQFLIGAAHHFELAKSLHDEQVASRR